ncbi:mitochondrial fusion and transport protein ugo1, partial [Ascosphaera pollenicola]
QNTQPKNTLTVSDHQDQHQHNGLEASTSQPSMISSESSHASSKRLPSTTKGDRENIITRSLAPLKTSTSLHRPDGQHKLKKSQSLSPLASGGGLREMACGEMDNASTDSAIPSLYWPTDFYKRGQSTDCLKYTRPTTASKRVKDLHRKACVSPLKISFPSELMDDVPLPIYPGSASSTSSHLYYSCNEEDMQNGSVMTLPSIGKNSMDGVISPPRRQSPLMTEYESSSDISTSGDEEIEVCEVKIESARRVRHRRVNAVEIKQIDIKPTLPPTPPMWPIQTPGSPVFRTLPKSIPRRRIQKRNMDALNRFMTRRSSSDPIQAPLTPPEDTMLSHSVSHPSLPKRPALHRGPAFRHSHSCAEPTMNFPSMACLPEEEVNKMRQQMHSSSSSASDQSSWSQGSDVSDASMQTFVDLKDASFVFN